MNLSILFGWGAPSFAEQLPDLSPTDASAFDEDNRAIIRLHVNGYITDSQRDAAIKKVTRAIDAALANHRAASGKTGRLKWPPEVSQELADEIDRIASQPDGEHHPEITMVADRLRRALAENGR